MLPAMQAPLRLTVMTLGPGAIWPALRRALWLPVLVFVLTVAVVIETGKAGWLSVGGAVISALGAKLWANRFFELAPTAATKACPHRLSRQSPERGV